MYRIIGADGKEYGPITEQQLLHWFREGRVNRETRVRSEGGTEWGLLGNLPMFAAAATPPLPRAIQPLYVVQHKRTHGFAITGMVTGILSLPACFCCSGMPLNLLGLIFSLLALSQIKNQPETFEGKGMATAGLICSITSLVLGIAIFVLGLALNLAEIRKDLSP